MSLSLVFAPYSLVIQRSLITSCDRRVVRFDGNEVTGTVEYSALGTPVIRGSEEKHLWTVEAFLALDQWRTIQGLQRLQTVQEDARQPSGIVLIDGLHEYIDPVARSRAIAPGASESPVVGGGVAYFAQFEVRLGAPTATPVKNTTYPWKATWQMAELGRIAP